MQVMFVHEHEHEHAHDDGWQTEYNAIRGKPLGKIPGEMCKRRRRRQQQVTTKSMGELWSSELLAPQPAPAPAPIPFCIVNVNTCAKATT